MTPELQRALRQYMVWFGSYKTSGELKKTEVWSIVTAGCIEFITPANTYKVERVRRNSRVICFLGSENGPAIPGTAEISTKKREILRIYRAYWKSHSFWNVLRVTPRILRQTTLGNRAMIRVRPDEPNPLAGVTDPAP
jgi:hypothetical protein